MEQQREKQEVFTYTYSAAQQEEINKIRQKYLPKEETKLDRLRKLDKSVTKKGTVISLAVGIIGALVMGSGMSMVTVYGGIWFIPGIIVGLLGICGIAAAYPLYGRITKKERDKVAPLILQLSEELMK